MTWIVARAITVGSSGPLRGRNCGKNEIANTAALGFAAIETSEARNAARGPWPRAVGENRRRARSRVGHLAAGAPPGLDAEGDQHDGADHVEAVKQQPVCLEQDRQPGAPGDHPTEQTDLVAGDGGEAGTSAVAQRAVQEDRRRRTREGGEDHTGD